MTAILIGEGRGSEIRFHTNHSVCLSVYLSVVDNVND